MTRRPNVYTEDETARAWKLIEDNRGLMYRAVGICRVADYEQDDFVSDVCHPCMFKVARGFNPELGFQFSTYAMRCMIRDIRREQAKRYRRQMGSLPEMEKGGEILPGRPDGGQSRIDAHEFVQDRLARLTPRQAAIVSARWLMGMKWREIGEIVGLSYERCRQIGAEALARMK